MAGTAEITPYVGTEMEWAVETQDVPGGGFKQIDEARAKRVVRDYHPKTLFMVGTFAVNGARFYVDVGVHPEYGTPEVTLEDIVAAEFAGERIVYETFENGRKKGLYHDFRLNKRVIDDEKKTWGYHESFSMSSKNMAIDFDHLAFSGLHIAAGNIFAGAGAVVRDDKGEARFRIAQKVLNLNIDASLSSHNADQPLISLRDEPHANEDTLRVHLTSYDANMSPWATWWRTGSAISVLRLVEHGDYGDDLMPEWPLHVLAKFVAADTTLKQSVQLARPLRGRVRRMSALEIEEEIATRADKLDLPDEERKVRQAWHNAISDMKRNPRLLADRVEWVGKQLAIEKYRQTHNVPLGDNEVHARDIKWADMRPEHGIAQAMRRSQMAYGKYMPSRKAVAYFTEHAPKNSRATLREWGIRETHRTGPHDGSADWEYVRLPNGKRIDLKDLSKVALTDEDKAPVVS